MRLPSIFAASAGVAAAMGVLSLAVARGRPSPRTVHPRPAPAPPAAQPSVVRTELGLGSLPGQRRAAATEPA